jgi:hypothetical protein
MAGGFILRFQDHCVENDVTDVRAGTQTMTKVKTEQPDTDPSGSEHLAIPRSSLPTGTITGTRIRTEEPDADRHSVTAAIPRIPKDDKTATRTRTAVRSETEDQDSGHQGVHIIPRCSSY